MVSDDKEYEFHVTKAELLDHLNNIGLGYIHHYRFDDDSVNQINDIGNIQMSEEDRNQYSFHTPSQFCNDTIRVVVTLHERGEGSILKLNYLVYNCDTRSPQRDVEAVRIFERDVIDRLRARIRESVQLTIIDNPIAN